MQLSSGVVFFVLIVASKRPETLGKVILPLAWAIPILTGYDTMEPAGEFLKEIFPRLDPRARNQIERAILSIPNNIEEKRRADAENVRNRLLGCLTGVELLLPETRQLFDQIRESKRVPQNKRPVASGQLRVGPQSDEYYMRQRGVPVEAEPNRRIRRLETPVKEFALKHSNSIPTLEQSADLLACLKALHDHLSGEVDSIDSNLLLQAWDSLTEACACVATTDGLLPVHPVAPLASVVSLNLV